MDNIPVVFEYKGVRFSGHLTEVSGGGAKLWHIIVGKKYIGKAWITNNEVRVATQKGVLERGAPEIIDYIKSLLSPFL
jgi:hypothetical protein